MLKKITQNKYLIDHYNPIHFVKRYLIRNEVKKIKPIYRIADLGCGSRIISQDLEKFGEVDAYDTDKSLIQFAKKSTKPSRVHYYKKIS